MDAITGTAAVFGRAFAELAAERNELEAAVRDLESARAAFALPEMEKFFANPLVPRAAKLEVADRVFAGCASTTFLPFLKVVVMRRRERLIPEILRAALHQCFDLLGVVVVAITTAMELDEELRAELHRRLEEHLGRPVHPEFRVNPNLLGGIVIRHGDRTLDASISGILRRMEDILACGLKERE